MGHRARRPWEAGAAARPRPRHERPAGGDPGSTAARSCRPPPGTLTTCVLPMPSQSATALRTGATARPTTRRAMRMTAATARRRNHVERRCDRRSGRSAHLEVRADAHQDLLEAGVGERVSHGPLLPPRAPRADGPSLATAATSPFPRAPRASRPSPLRSAVRTIGARSRADRRCRAGSARRRHAAGPTSLTAASSGVDRLLRHAGMAPRAPRDVLGGPGHVDRCARSFATILRNHGRNGRAPSKVSNDRHALSVACCTTSSAPSALPSTTVATRSAAGRWRATRSP